MTHTKQSTIYSASSQPLRTRTASSLATDPGVFSSICISTDGSNFVLVRWSNSQVSAAGLMARIRNLVQLQRHIPARAHYAASCYSKSRHPRCRGKARALCPSNPRDDGSAIHRHRRCHSPRNAHRHKPCSVGHFVSDRQTLPHVRSVRRRPSITPVRTRCPA